MSEHQYIYSDMKDEVELNRLTQQANILDRARETIGAATARAFRR